MTRRIVWVMSAGAWLFLFTAFATFDLADWPSNLVAVHNVPAANWCGPAGAAIAWNGLMVFGVAVWVMLAAAGAYLGVTATGRRMTHPVVRAVGVLLAALALASIHALWFPNVGSIVAAKAGLLPRLIADQLTLRFSAVGVSLLLLTTVLLGAVVAVDWMVLSLPKALGRFFMKAAELRHVDWGAPLRVLGRIRVPRWSRQPVAAGVGDFEMPVEVKTRSRRKVVQEQIDPDAGGIGATEAFVPEEHEVEDVVEAPVKPGRSTLSEEDLRKKISKLPVRMTGKVQMIAKDEDIPRGELCGVSVPDTGPA